MTFTTDKMALIAFGLISGVLGGTALMISLFSDINIWLLGIIMAFISFSIFTYNSRLEIDKNSSTIIKKTRFLSKEYCEKYSFDQFTEVGIGILGSSGDMGNIINYRLVLIKKNGKILKIPRIIESENEVKRLAQNLSNYIDLPVSLKPRTILFDRLL